MLHVNAVAAGDEGLLTLTAYQAEAAESVGTRHLPQKTGGLVEVEASFPADREALEPNLRAGRLPATELGLLRRVQPQWAEFQDGPPISQSAKDFSAHRRRQPGGVADLCVPATGRGYR
jgi:hypothetical protein